MELGVGAKLKAIGERIQDAWQPPASGWQPTSGLETVCRPKINSPKRTTGRVNRVENQLLTPDDELTFTTSLGGGPGGQNVNTLTTI
jgi:hypothetical protein